MPDLDISAAALDDADLGRLDTLDDLDLLKLLAQWPRMVSSAARAHEPHRIAFYLHELASGFHMLWARGNEEPQLRFVNRADPTLTLARLAMVDAVRLVLANGLTILGVSAPEELS
jgi:arginyl-tRNA synthetase